MSNCIPRDVAVVIRTLGTDLAGITPKGKRLLSLLEEGKYDEYVNETVRPSDYTKSENYFADAVIHSFLRKCVDLPTTFDRRQAAVDTFNEAESACYRTNQRLYPFLYNTYGDEDPCIHLLIEKVQDMALRILGRNPPSNPAGRFGPGSTYGDKGSLSTIPDKMQSVPTLTSNSVWFLFPWVSTQWGIASINRGDSIQFVRGNRFTTVDKTCKTDRGICIENTIPLFYQLGYGSAIRSRLQAVGIDLDHAQETHRQVAREASISGKNATIDLKTASDRKCRAFVELALRRTNWHEPLDALRSPCTQIDGSWRVLEKFSSMGNGFTFELETALFLSVSMAVMDMRGIAPLPGQNVHVFGDDIIVPTEVALDVIAALQFFGFETNKEKSFVSGPFRESCGGDFFNGQAVRPYFLGEYPNEPQQYIAMANGIRRLGHDDSCAGARRLNFRRAWFHVLDNLPVHIRRCRGPEGLGDLVIHDDIEFWDTRTRSCIRYVKVYRPARHREVKWSVFDPDVILAGATYGLPWSNGTVKPRDSVVGYKVGWVSYS